MLRNRLRGHREELKRLQESLKFLQKERHVSLTELSFPGAEKPLRATADGKPFEWESVDEINSTPTGKDEPTFRTFQQVVQAPTLLKAPIEKLRPGSNNTSVLDAATGLGTTVSSFANISQEDVYLLRKLHNSMIWVNQSPLGGRREALHWLGLFKSKPHLLKLLTPYAWKLLWAFETSVIPSYRSRLVGEMMVAAEVEMTEEDEIKYIGGLFWNGGRDEAFRRLDALLEKSPSLAVWNLKIRMFAMERNAPMAKQTLEEMISALGFTEHKTLIPVIMCYNHVGEPEKAWEEYTNMKMWAERNREKIKIAQFDDLAMSFLDQGQASMGLDVYRDMLHAEHKAIDRIQTHTYENLETAVRAAQDRAGNPETLRHVAMDTLLTLPPKVVNKHFFGGWILNLLKMGRIDLAEYLVREGIASCGHKPESHHINWVIQGWLNEGNWKAAEALAQEMIEERKNSLKVWRLGSAASRTAPATIQTFSLLIQYCTRRNRSEKVKSLFNQMHECQIPADSYTMNHVLLCLYRQREYTAIKTTFDTMLRTGIKPDFESFRVVWMAMHKKGRFGAKMGMFYTPRELFNLTAHKFSLQAADEVDKFDLINMWHSMIASFMVHQDTLGCLLALHAGGEIWGMDVDETIVEDVVTGILKTQQIHRRGGKVTEERVQESVDLLRQWGETLIKSKRRKRRGKALVAEGGQEWMTFEAVTMFLRNELVVDTTTVKAAKMEMGLEGIKMGRLL